MNIELVADEPSLQRLIARVRTADRVALDTEFHTEKHFTPRLMVVQIAFVDAVAIVDPLALGDLSALADALVQTTVVGHALSSDLRIFYDAFGRLPQVAYDTQVAAAFCGLGVSISLLDLVRDVTGVTLRKTQTVSDWGLRPLTEKQLDYLVDDVRYLFAVADELETRLQTRGRAAWAREEMASLVDPATYQSDRRRLYLRVSGNARLNRRELGILNELAALREAVARERNVPVRYVLADDVIASVVSLHPASIEDLTQLRRLDAGARKHLGGRIIEAIAAGDAIPEADLPPRAPRPLGSARDTMVAAMALLVNAIATANEIPATLLVSRAELERIARELPSDSQTLGDIIELSPWRRDLIVEPMMALLSGSTSIRIEGYAAGAPRAVLAPAAPDGGRDAANAAATPQ